MKNIFINNILLYKYTLLKLKKNLYFLYIKNIEGIIY